MHMEKAKSQCQDIPEEQQVGGICLSNYSKSPMHEPSSCDFQRWEHASRQGRVGVSPLPTVQLRCLPPPLPPLVSNASCP